MEKTGKWQEQIGAFIETSLEYLTKSRKLALASANRHLEKGLSDFLKKEFWHKIEKHHKIDDPNHDDKKIHVIHYTSIANLVSMLNDVCDEPDREHKDGTEGNREKKTKPVAEKSTLRLYDSFNLNDPDEGNYLIRHSDLFKKYCWLREGELSSHAYMSSFILPDNKKNMGDNLVFWRAYGQEGEGCSLSVPIPCRRLRKVLYGEKDWQPTIAVLGELLCFLDTLIKEYKKQPIKEYMEKYYIDIEKKSAEIFFKFLEKIRYLYKSEAYAYEQECRFVIAEADIQEKSKIRFENQNWNNSSTRLRHYYEHEDLEIKKLLVTGCTITLGPCVFQPHNVRYCLRSLMDRANLKGQEIRISEIPYRKS